MIQAIRQFTPQNKVKVQKQNFGFNSRLANDGAGAHKLLIRVQKGVEKLKPEEKPELLKAISDAYTVFKNGKAAGSLEDLAMHLGWMEPY